MNNLPKFNKVIGWINLIFIVLAFVGIVSEGGIIDIPTLLVLVLMGLSGYLLLTNK